MAYFVLVVLAAAITAILRAVETMFWDAYSTA